MLSLVFVVVIHIRSDKGSKVTFALPVVIIPTRRIFRLFYKQYFYTQRQVEIEKKIKQKLSNTLRLNVWIFKIICFLHPHCHPKIKGDILKKSVKNKCVCFNDII